MRTTTIFTLLAASATFSGALPARACLFSSRIADDETQRIATAGYLVRARVIRGYDSTKRQPELLAIERVYVGGDLPSTVELSRDDAFYDARPPDAILLATCEDEFSEPQKNGVVLILFPVSPAADGRPARFNTGQYVTWASPRDMRNLYTPVIRAAHRTGRLRAKPYWP